MIFRNIPQPTCISAQTLHFPYFIADKTFNIFSNRLPNSNGTIIQLRNCCGNNNLKFFWQKEIPKGNFVLKNLYRDLWCYFFLHSTNLHKRWWKKLIFCVKQFWIWKWNRRWIWVENKFSLPNLWFWSLFPTKVTGHVMKWYQCFYFFDSPSTQLRKFGVAKRRISTTTLREDYDEFIVLYKLLLK